MANKPAFDQLINDPMLAHVDFATINVDELPQLAQREGAQSIPTFIFLQKGERVGTFVGGQSAASLRQEIQARFATTGSTTQEKEPMTQTVAQPEQSGFWHNVKKGFTWIIDGITSTGSYIGKKIKNLFS